MRTYKVFILERVTEAAQHKGRIQYRVTTHSMMFNMDRIFYYRFQAANDDEAVKKLSKELFKPEDPRPLACAYDISKCRANFTTKRRIKLDRNLCLRCFRETRRKIGSHDELFDAEWDFGRACCKKARGAHHHTFYGRRPNYWKPPKDCPYYLEHFLWFQQQQEEGSK